MKKFAVLLALVLAATLARAEMARLTRERPAGPEFKLCVYDDGTTLTVRFLDMCPPFIRKD